MSKIKGLNKFTKLACGLLVLAIIFMVIGLIMIGSVNIDLGLLGKVTGFDIVKNAGVSNVLSNNTSHASQYLGSLGNKIHTLQAGLVFAAILTPILAGLAIIAAALKFIIKK